MAIPGQIPKGLYHATDTRYNLSEIPSQLDPQARARIERQAESVACLVDKRSLTQISRNGATVYCVSDHVPRLEGIVAKDLRKHASGPLTHEQTSQTYRGPFSGERTLGTGTAFLVGKQLILTAAHCMNKPKLADLRVIFGFQTGPSGQVPTDFAERDVYRIEGVWRDLQEAGPQNQPISDWAILKLDREAEGREPLRLKSNRPPPKSMPLYMLGHPNGLPLKLAWGGEVQEDSDPHFFDADLDAFEGNSGSPVFASNTGDLIGMLVRGNKDYEPLGAHIRPAKISKEIIETSGFEKCHKLASLEIVKTVLSSFFKMATPHFSGRVNHLADLKTHLTTPAPSTRVCILYGPGGIGKSELAIAFANKNIEDFSFIWSIACGTKKEALVGYHELATRLEITLEERENLASLIRKVNLKLEENRGKPWLLLLDNLEQVPQLPHRGGSILITSYKRLAIQPFAEGAIVTTPVLPLELEEALKLLEDITEKPLADCEKLLSHVGSYPLILWQAANSIRHGGISVERYLADFQQHRVRSQSHEAAALETAFERTLKQLSPPARRWLFICSKLRASEIPQSYLQTWLQNGSPAAVIAELVDHALLCYNPQNEVFWLDLELQRILKSVAPPETTSQALCLLKTMGDDWNFENNEWLNNLAKARIWEYHVQFFLANTQPTLLHNLDAASVFEKLGLHAFENGYHDMALAYHKQAWDTRRAILEEHHPDIAKSLSNLCRCFCLLGKIHLAKCAHTDAIKIYRAAYGENHQDVANNLFNMSIYYQREKDYGTARAKLKEALVIYQALHSNLDIARTLHNIGCCHLKRAYHAIDYFNPSHYEEAMAVFNQELAILRTLYEEPHPDIDKTLRKISACEGGLTISKCAIS